MCRYNIVWSQEAKENLRNIFTYIVIRDSERKARYILAQLDDFIRKIAFIPEKYIKEPHLNNPAIRVAVKWRYKIIFRIVGTDIHIIRIFHTSQSPEKLYDSLGSSV